jgi:hypothetical protein
MNSTLLIEEFFTPITQSPEVCTQSEHPDEQPLEEYLAQFEAEQELWHEYYHACGSW